jgi:hypothetical protein
LFLLNPRVRSQSKGLSPEGGSTNRQRSQPLKSHQRKYLAPSAAPTKALKPMPPEYQTE